MKTSDLLVIGGIGLLAYMLMKPKADAEGGGITSFIPIPSTENAMPTIINIPSADTPQAPLDIGGIFSGMSNMFSGLLGAIPSQVPSQIIPEINIPELIIPDIDIPELPGLPDFPGWDKYMPDWEKFIPALPDELKLPDLLPDLFPDIPNPLDILDPFNLFGGNGNGVSQWNIWKSDTGQTISDFGETLRKITTMPGYFVPKQYYEIAEAEWEEKGYPKEMTPEWWYARKEASSGISSESNTIDEETLPYSENKADIELLKKHPYFSKVI